jgi:hypothetical protein
MALCLNLSSWCEMNTYMNDLIVQQNIFWFVMSLNIILIATKRLIVLMKKIPWNFTDMKW